MSDPVEGRLQRIEDKLDDLHQAMISLARIEERQATQFAEARKLNERIDGVETRVKAEQAYMLCIRTALLCFARGDSPMTAVEFARRNIEPHERPSFSELESMTRRKAA